ncbi:hypothetical protein AAFF_G00295070 [Aldrovandia affinis]|uniref:Uncharacterized protein n=1 Tax=Aldrovandia affinis TaxID=143900 RepID=A0AAD7R8U0_9TELE|nr:hypothetical protein AAFF_G00295070 [Aldrovandia affinis]
MILENISNIPLSCRHIHPSECKAYRRRARRHVRFPGPVTETSPRPRGARSAPRRQRDRTRAPRASSHRSAGPLRNRTTSRSTTALQSGPRRGMRTADPGGLSVYCCRRRCPSAKGSCAERASVRLSGSSDRRSGDRFRSGPRSLDFFTPSNVTI